MRTTQKSISAAFFLLHYISSIKTWKLYSLISLNGYNLQNRKEIPYQMQQEYPRLQELAILFLLNPN